MVTVWCGLASAPLPHLRSSMIRPVSVSVCFRTPFSGFGSVGAGTGVSGLGVGVDAGTGAGGAAGVDLDRVAGVVVGAVPDGAGLERSAMPLDGFPGSGRT